MSGDIEWVSLLGGLAAILSLASFGPQAVKIIATRDTSALSASMYVITVSAFACWMAYGLARSDWPLVASNLVCGVLAGFILVMKLLPKRQTEAVADAIAPLIPGVDDSDPPGGHGTSADRSRL